MIFRGEEVEVALLDFERIVRLAGLGRHPM